MCTILKLLGGIQPNYLGDISPIPPCFGTSACSYLYYYYHKCKKGLINRGGVEDTRLEAKAKDSLSEDRHSRGQGQECSRPRPRTKDSSASALQKKKGLHKNFSGDLHKKRFPKNFSSAPQNFNNSKNSAVLVPRTGQFSRT